MSIAEIFTKYRVYFIASSHYLFASLFSALSTIIINPYLAKNLSPYDYAVIGYFNSFSYLILPILNFGLITFYLRKYYTIPKERREIVEETILIALLLMGAVLLCVILLAFSLYFSFAKVSYSFWPYTIVAFLPLFMNNIVTLYQVKCRLKREAKNYNVITIALALLNVAFALLLVVIFNYGAIGKMYGILFASSIIAVFSAVKLFGKLRFDLNVIKEALSFSWPLTLSAILWYFVSGVDAVLLERLDDKVTYGVYSVGSQIAGHLSLIYVAIAQTFEPDIYHSISTNYKSRLLKIILVVIFINSLPNILFILFAEKIVDILTYGQYTVSTEYAQIFALKNIISSIYYSVISVIIGYGYTRIELVIKIIGAVLAIAIFKILIDNYTFYGAAFGQIIILSIMTLLGILFMVKKGIILFKIRI